jgi:hypothetical protein
VSYAPVVIRGSRSFRSSGYPAGVADTSGRVSATGTGRRIGIEQAREKVRNSDE